MSEAFRLSILNEDGVTKNIFIRLDTNTGHILLNDHMYRMEIKCTIPEVQLLVRNHLTVEFMPCLSQNQQNHQNQQNQWRDPNQNIPNIRSCSCPRSCKLKTFVLMAVDQFGLGFPEVPSSFSRELDAQAIPILIQSSALNKNFLPLFTPIASTHRQERVLMHALYDCQMNPPTKPTAIILPIRDNDECDPSYAPNWHKLNLSVKMSIDTARRELHRPVNN